MQVASHLFADLSASLEDPHTTDLRGRQQMRHQRAALCVLIGREADGIRRRATTMRTSCDR